MKLGILGGTFDPPHLGHLIMAQEALEQCALDRVTFVPSAAPPHKNTPETRAADRLEMVKMAVAGNPDFDVSAIEIERGGTSYTLDTLNEVKRQHPDDAIYFIIGGDMVNDLKNWHGFDEMRERFSFIGLGRPGTAISAPPGVDLRMIDMPQLGISSTIIRKMAAAGAACRYYVPEPVRIYMKERGLYG